MVNLIAQAQETLPLKTAEVGVGIIAAMMILKWGSEFVGTVLKWTKVRDRDNGSWPNGAQVAREHTEMLITMKGMQKALSVFADQQHVINTQTTALQHTIAGTLEGLKDEMCDSHHQLHAQNEETVALLRKIADGVTS